MQNNKVTFIWIGKKGIHYREEDLQTFVRNSTFRSTSEYPEEVSHGKQ